MLSENSLSFWEKPYTQLHSYSISQKLAYRKMQKSQLARDLRYLKELPESHITLISLPAGADPFLNQQPL